MKKVSVLIPAYNAEPYIKAAIDSILGQTYQDFELIVVDDCSTDDTYNIISQYVARDSRITAFRNEHNQGIAKNRNKLLGFATGEYIIWQEADDISLPQRIEHQLAFMEAHPNVAICGGYLECFDEKKIVGIRKYSSIDAELRKLVFRYAPVPQPAAIIRRSCLIEVGPYNPDYTPADDLEMTLRLGSHYELANLPEIVMRFRIHNNANSTTFTKLKKLELNTLAIRQKYANEYGMSLFDKIYNLAQYISIFIVPPRLKIWLFNRFRNSKA